MTAHARRWAPVAAALSHVLEEQPDFLSQQSFRIFGAASEPRGTVRGGAGPSPT